jgi:hypothetical protein
VENLIGQSFAWPFRGRWKASWALGLAAVLLLPIAFIPLLGYAVAATRAASQGAEGPPPWRFDARLLTDGFWVAFTLVLVTVPYALADIPLSLGLSAPALWHASGPLLAVYGHLTATLILALPWGVMLLLVMPHATARYASSGRPVDMFDLGASLRGVRRDFATWNVAIAAIVTAWAIGLACIGLLCVGLVPGIFYAILVSAHAAAALHPASENPPAR